MFIGHMYKHYKLSESFVRQLYKKGINVPNNVLIIKHKCYFEDMTFFSFPV